jgi:hypothetical protein
MVPQSRAMVFSFRFQYYFAKRLVRKKRKWKTIELTSNMQTAQSEIKSEKAGRKGAE